MRLEIENFINSLNPKYHKHLIQALKSNLDRPQSFHAGTDTNDGVSSDVITEMITKAMNALNNKYIEGGIEYIDKYYPDLSSKIGSAEGIVNTQANACYGVKIELEEFRSALKNWYHLNINAIEIYRNKILKKD